MAGSTTPDAYAYPTTGDGFALVSDLATMAASSQAAMLAHAVTVANISTLDALSTSLIGATATMTNPGTGISAINWVAASGTGASIKWNATQVVYAATKANLDTFIAAVAATADLRFIIGGLAYVSGTNNYYQFTSVVGAYTAFASGSRIPIIPTVAGTGVSVSGYRVVASASSTVSVDGLSSTYDFYDIAVNGQLSANSEVTLRLRTGGADISSANYNDVRVFSTTASGVAQALAATAFRVSIAPGAANGWLDGTIRLSMPAAAQPTGYDSGVNSSVGNTAHAQSRVTGQFSLTTSITGFSIICASGNFTGTINVEGRNRG